MFHIDVIKDGDVSKVKSQTLVDGQMYVDETPREGSANLVTSGGVNKAIGDTKESVDEDVQDLQEQIDDIAEKAGSGYIPKGEADVATLNALSGQENGWLYTMTDAGTLTDGSLAVVAGDTVAWDATNEVWYKAMDYAPMQYGTNEVHNLPTPITAFRTGDVIPVDGPSGTAKMGKDDLLKETAENALAGNVAPAFDPTRTSETAYSAGEDVVYNGKHYVFKVAHYGDWDSDDVEEITSQLLQRRKIVDLNDKTLWHSGYISSDSGTIRPSTTRWYSDPFAFEAGQTILYSFTDVASVIRIFCYDKKQDYIGLGSSRSIDNLLAQYPNAYFFRCVVYDCATINDFWFTSFKFLRDDSDLQQAIAENAQKIYEIEEYTKNPIDLNSTGYWHEGKINSTTGAIESGTGRLYTDLFELTSDSVIDYDVAEGVSVNRRFCAWDADGNFLGMRNTLSVADMLAHYSTAKYFRFYFPSATGATLSVDNLNSIVTFLNNVYIKSEGIEKRVEALEEKSESVSTDFLAGAKWYACGDSFTAGSGVPNLPSGKYKGYPMVYPYFIGNRTNIDVYNIAVSGSTLADRDGATESNCFSYPNGKYTKIPVDAKYITLKFGINDNHQNTPIGEDDDATNATFKGAWNVVLQEIISTHPLAHIGIIVTNGCTDPAYPLATIAMARKYGIPYLDEDGGDQVPLILRTTRKDYVLDSIKQIKYDAMIVGEQDGEINRHPNEYAHEFESRFVETWMRTL